MSVVRAILVEIRLNSHPQIFRSCIVTFSISINVPQVTQADVNALRAYTAFIGEKTKLPVIDDMHTAEKLAWKQAKKACKRDERIVSLDTHSYSAGKKTWCFTFTAVHEE
jgi:hypothetical protein